eukprot:SAG22_NODE_4661_length_1201_cov_1.605263_1_plen_182_part_10
MEAALAETEAQLMANMQWRDGSESGAALAEKAQGLRSDIKQEQARLAAAKDVFAAAAQEEVAIFSRTTRLSTDGFAKDADGWQSNLAATAAGGPGLSEEEKQMIAEHKANQALMSDQALKTKAKRAATAAAAATVAPAVGGGADDAGAAAEASEATQRMMSSADAVEAASDQLGSYEVVPGK